MIGDAVAAIPPETEQAMRKVLAEIGGLSPSPAGACRPGPRIHRLVFHNLGNEILLQLFDLF